MVEIEVIDVIWFSRLQTISLWQRLLSDRTPSKEEAGKHCRMLTEITHQDINWKLIYLILEHCTQAVVSLLSVLRLRLVNIVSTQAVVSLLSILRLWLVNIDCTQAVVSILVVLRL